MSYYLFTSESVSEGHPDKVADQISDAMLALLRPIYSATANYGHFGREEPEFTWERTDKASLLRNLAGL